MMLQMHFREFQQEILRQLTPRQIRSMVQLPITEPSGSEPGELQCNSDENVCLLPLVLISYVLDRLLKVETVVKENLLFVSSKCGQALHLLLIVQWLSTCQIASRHLEHGSGWMLVPMFTLAL